MTANLVITESRLIAAGRWMAMLALLVATVSGLGAEPAATDAGAEDTNRLETLRGFLQLQEQLRATQLALEARMKEGDSGAYKATLELANRLQGLETALAGQRSRELDVLQSTNRTMLLVAGFFGVVGLAAMVFMVHFQWRAASRLAEISSGLPGLRSFGSGSALLGLGEHLPLPPGQAQDYSARLLGALDLLEKRIANLEGKGPKAIHESSLTATEGEVVDVKDGQSRSFGSLMAEGQLFLDADKPEEALDRFQQALSLQATPDVLVKKGAALEKLNRLEAALECYEQAISADRTLTIAFLHKGGVLNRMERFDEALSCYEQALQAQEKRAA